MFSIRMTLSDSEAGMAPASSRQASSGSSGPQHMLCSMNSVGSSFMIWSSPDFIALVGQQILPALLTSPSSPLHHTQHRPWKAERVGMPMFRSMSVQIKGPSLVRGRGSPSPISPPLTGISCSFLPAALAEALVAVDLADALLAALAAALAASNASCSSSVSCRVGRDEAEGSSASSGQSGPWCLSGAQHFAGRPVAAASLEPTAFFSPSRLISISL
mmetsp:Transcript_8254/g.19481  ORF Transcript_8254/g.19481 Transcript_8254/m.19481 type:complete len:217 (+) Transcript_8254:1685-2335(+)